MVVLVVAPAEVMVEHNLTTDVNNDKMTDYKKKLERIFDEQYKVALKKYLDERKPNSFNNMIESMSWYTNMRKEFIEKMGLKDEK